MAGDYSRRLIFACRIKYRYGSRAHCASPSRGTREGEGDRRESKHRVKLILVGAVEGLYIGTITKNQESLHLIHRFACR